MAMAAGVDRPMPVKLVVLRMMGRVPQLHTHKDTHQDKAVEDAKRVMACHEQTKGFRVGTAQLEQHSQESPGAAAGTAKSGVSGAVVAHLVLVPRKAGWWCLCRWRLSKQTRHRQRCRSYSR
jgi:hypothetical protein